MTEELVGPPWSSGSATEGTSPWSGGSTAEGTSPWSGGSTAEVTVHVAPCLRSDETDDDQRTAARRAFELIAQHLAACRAEEGYCITFADPDHLRCFLCAHSEERPLLRQLAAAGRAELSAGYHQFGGAAGHGEGLLRNLALGLQACAQSVGLKPIACLTFNAGEQCLQLPQLLRKAGVEAIVWSAAHSGLPSFGYLLAPDGSMVILKPQPGECLPGNVEELLALAAEGFSAQARLGLNCDLLLLGGAGTPPQEWLRGRGAELAQLTPPLVLSTPRRYLAEAQLEGQLRRPSLPLLGREIGGKTILDPPSWELGHASRLAENAILSAERLGTLAYLAGADYPHAALDKAQRQTLFAQGNAHRASGTWRFDLLACCQEALELARQVGERSLAYLSSQVDTRRARGAPREGAAIVVSNTTGHQRTDVCEVQVSLEGPLASGFELADDRGRRVPVECVTAPRAYDSPGALSALVRFVAADVPALGYRTWYLRPARTMPPVCTRQETASASIENEFLSVSAEAAAGSGLISLREKSSGRELLDRERGLGAEVVGLAASGEMNRPGESKTHLSVWKGPVSSQLEIGTTLPDGGRVRQEVILHHGLARLDLRTAVVGGWSDSDALALRFPFTLPAEAAVCGAPFGAVVRRGHNAWLADGESGRLGFWLTHDWLDVGPLPSLYVVSRPQGRRAVPLGPCAIITSGDLRQRAVLPALENALLSRGVTCTPHLDTDDLDADPAACSLRISLGRGNAHSQQVLQDRPEAAACLSDAVKDREWAAVLLPGAGGKADPRTIPTLVVDASAPQGLPRAIEALAAAVASDSLEIPESCDFVGGDAKTSPRDSYGLAVLSPRPLAATADREGALVVLLNPGATEQDAGAPTFFEHFLLPHRGDWRENGVDRAACFPGNPLMAVQTTLQSGALPPEFGLCSVDAPNVIVTACRPPRSQSSGQVPKSREIIVRFYESHGKATSARLDFGVGLEEAWVSDLVDGRGSALTVTAPRRGLLRGEGQAPGLNLEVGANEIVTVGLRLAPLAVAAPPARRSFSEGGAAKRAQEPSLGPTTEPCQPLFSRYWDHNSGAAPMGDQPLSLWMRGELPIGRNTRFSLGLSNDSDREMVGKVEIAAPAEWNLIPRQVPYRIAPWSEAVYEIMIDIPPNASPCFLRATTHDGTHTMQDVLAIGEIAPLGVSLTRDEAGFAVTIENPNPDYVEGSLTLVTPVQSWGEAAGSWAACRVSPRLHGLRVEAGGKDTFRFAIKGEMPGLWAVAKVAWYGRVQYAYL